MLALRVIARVIGMLWMLTIALFGLGATLFCLDGFISLGSARPDRLIGLPGVHRHVGRFLDQIAAPGPTAGLALLCGLGAMLLGLLLLLGTLRSSPQRLAVLNSDSGGGTLAAKPKAIKEMVRALAEQTAGATNVKRPKLRLSRRGTRGKLKVTVSHAQTSDRREVQRAVQGQLEPISGPFGLRARVRVRLGREGERVQ